MSCEKYSDSCPARATRCREINYKSNEGHKFVLSAVHGSGAGRSDRGLPADLKITLDLISQGLEDKIPDDLCGIWAQGESDHDYEPWLLPDFRTLLGR